jgi:hypothetical protein
MNTKEQIKPQAHQRWIIDCANGLHSVLAIYNPNNNSLELRDIYPDKISDNTQKIDLNNAYISPYSVILQLFGFDNRITEILS